MKKLEDFTISDYSQQLSHGDIIDLGDETVNGEHLFLLLDSDSRGPQIIYYPQYLEGIMRLYEYSVYSFLSNLNLDGEKVIGNIFKDKASESNKKWLVAVNLSDNGRFNIKIKPTAILSPEDTPTASMVGEFGISSRTFRKYIKDFKLFDTEDKAQDYFNSYIEDKVKEYEKEYNLKIKKVLKEKLN